MRRLTSLSVMAAVAAMALSGPAEARDLRVAAGAPPVHTAYNPLYSTFRELLPEMTGGTLGTTHLGTEVVTVGNMMAQLQSGVVEVGNLLPLFVPADLPNTALTGDLAFLGRVPHAMAAAVDEYIVTCADCQAEFRAAGMVYLGTTSSDVYLLMTTRPVRTRADMAGMRLRAGGAAFARWADAMGAAPTQVPVNEQFEAISQGVLDGTMGSINDLVAFRLVDVIRHVTPVELGTYHTSSAFTVNGDVWRGLSQADREGIARAANVATALATQDWGHERADIAREMALAAGITFVEPDPALVTATEAFAEADLATIAAQARDRYGIADGAGKIARFRALIEKWEAIAAEVGEDPAAMAERKQAEIWDKVDWSTYGM